MPQKDLHSGVKRGEGYSGYNLPHEQIPGIFFYLKFTFRMPWLKIGLPMYACASLKPLFEPGSLMNLVHVYSPLDSSMSW